MIKDDSLTASQISDVIPETETMKEQRCELDGNQDGDEANNYEAAGFGTKSAGSYNR